jgi:hypothetical protein
MCCADVIKSHRSPDLGLTRSFVKAAFSAVLRDRDSNITRSREIPKVSNKGTTKLASAGTFPNRLASPPEYKMRASG